MFRKIKCSSSLLNVSTPDPHFLAAVLHLLCQIGSSSIVDSCTRLHTRSDSMQNDLETNKLICYKCPLPEIAYSRQVTVKYSILSLYTQPSGNFCLWFKRIWLQYIVLITKAFFTLNRKRNFVPLVWGYYTE